MENRAAIEGASAAPSQIGLGGVLRIPAVRQILLLVGVAASVAAGFAVVQWSRSPVYAPLYRDLETADAVAVAEALRASGIDYKLDTESGVVLVAESRLHDARLELASQGLPQGTAAGMELISGQSSFGVSQFMEGARYQHALEAELARTIAHIGEVREARVHLALPKQSAFLRDQKGASASVLLTLERSRQLESDQAAAIVNLIASSIPNLSADDVTLIDQHGRLLSAPGSEAVDAQAATQFRHARRLEETYRRRIEELLAPLVGPDRVRAQVVASLDFTVSEQTRETFDPASSVVRSEHISEEARVAGGLPAEGIPGALSNQPPGAAAQEKPKADAETGEAAVAAEPMNTSRVATRNFEMDRTISHVRPQPGIIRRLSVAVLVDDAPPAGSEADGADGAQPALTQEDVDRFTALVKEAVGFDAERGDSVVVMKAAFREAPELEPAAPPKIWEKPVVRDYLKQILGALVVLAIGFGLVRPLLKNLVAQPAGGGEYAGRAVVLAGGAAGGQRALTGPGYDEKLKAARNIVGHDPARVAQLVRKWTASDV